VAVFLPSLITTVREATKGATHIILCGVPDNTPGSGCRMNRPLRAVANELSKDKSLTVQVCEDAFTRSGAMPPAKSRAPCTSTEEADEAGEAEARTITLSPSLLAYQVAHPEACLVLVDDISSTAITLGGIHDHFKHTYFPDQRMELVALHTTQTLAGIARGTLGMEASTAAMAAELKRILPEGIPRVGKKDTATHKVYVRSITASQRELEALVGKILGDSKSMSWLVLWAVAWRDANMGAHVDKKSRGGEGKLYTINYWGQSTRYGWVRWQEEDRGEAPGLLYSLAALLKRVWTNKVVLDASDLQRLADAGQTTITGAMNWAEWALYESFQGSYKEGGANCIKPGPNSWKRMDMRMEDLLRAYLGFFSGSAQDGWVKSAAGQAAIQRMWAWQAVDFCSSDARLLAHIQRYSNVEFPVNPTAWQVYSALKSHAGEFHHLYPLPTPTSTPTIAATFWHTRGSTHRLSFWHHH
jgi:hypothetical protein